MRGAAQFLSSITQVASQTAATGRTITTSTLSREFHNRLRPTIALDRRCSGYAVYLPAQDGAGLLRFAGSRQQALLKEPTGREGRWGR